MNDPELYGIPAETIAFLCKVNVRTARRWKKGERRMPETAGMILSGDLGCFDLAWRGWILRDGKLISPEGWELSPGDVLSISLMRAQIAAYRAKERQFEALEEQPLPGVVPAIFA
jgi:Phage protein